MKIRCWTVTAGSLALLLAASGAVAREPPGLLPQGTDLWGKPDYGSAEAAADRSALEKGLGQAKAVTELIKQALELYKALSAADEAMSPNYQPPGAPDIPSQCMEADECKVCYGDAQGKLNKTRQGLEKLRAIYFYTTKFTANGEAIMSSAGTAGGTVAAMGAQAEIQKVDASLSDFKAAARSKRDELLEHAKANLKAISACEKTFYKNDDWYNRYGFMYYQFLISQYSVLQ